MFEASFHWVLNKVLGWDYIYWKNTCANGIERVKVNPSGEIYYMQYGKHLHKINKPDDVVWMTCHKEKYFLNNNKGK
jgi:hypothetical protein